MKPGSRIVVLLRRLARPLFPIGLAAVVLMSGCAVTESLPLVRPTSSTGNVARLPLAKHDGEPLWRARELLDEAIADSEWRLRQGFPVRASLLAHLRLTRGALDVLGRGETDRAADLFERAIAADGGEGFAYLYLGKLYLEAGRVDEGKLLIERASALLPRDAVLRGQVEALRRRDRESPAGGPGASR